MPPSESPQKHLAENSRGEVLSVAQNSRGEALTVASLTQVTIKELPTFTIIFASSPFFSQAAFLFFTDYWNPENLLVSSPVQFHACFITRKCHLCFPRDSTTSCFHPFYSAIMHRKQLLRCGNFLYSFPIPTMNLDQTIPSLSTVVTSQGGVLSRRIRYGSLYLSLL